MRVAGGLASLRRWTSVAAVAFAFVGARAYAWWTGVRFDASEWERFWHFVDPVLLQERLGESLWYLHSQPPLPNLALGVLLRVFGGEMPIACHAIFVALSALLAASTYSLARRLGVGTWLAAFGAATLCASPGVLLYENFLFYTSPLAALLALIALGIHRAVGSGRARDAFWAVGSAALAAWTWGLFHPAWLLAIVFYLAWWMRGDAAAWRRLAAAAALPCLLVLAVPLKNFVLFDEFAASSWRRMSLARVTLDRIPPELRAHWIEGGELSPVARVGPFKPLARYRDVVAPSPSTGVPLLDMPTKSNGAENLHHLAYLTIGRALARDAWHVIRRRPDLYLRSVERNLWRATAPASSYRPLAPNRPRLATLERVYAALLLRASTARGAWLLAVAIPLLVGYGVVVAVRRRDRASAWRATVLYLALTTTFVVVGSALVERSENERFRFLVDSHLVLLALVAVNDLAALLSDRSRAFRARRHSTSVAPAAR